MEEKRIVEVTIRTNNKKPKCCSLECKFNYLDNKLCPDKAFCDLYQKNLNTYLDFENMRWLWVERCEDCLNYEK